MPPSRIAHSVLKFVTAWLGSLTRRLTSARHVAMVRLCFEARPQTRAQLEEPLSVRAAGGEGSALHCDVFSTAPGAFVLLGTGVWSRQLRGQKPRGSLFFSNGHSESRRV